MVQAERQTIERMRAGHGPAEAIARRLCGDPEPIRRPLNEDQRRLVHDALHTKDQIFGVQGGAGTGKTTALSAVREIAEEHGYRTVGLGPTSRAAKGLKEAGMEAETLQAFLTRGRDPGAEDARPRLFFVDESSLASGKQMRDFLERLGARDRVLLIGDTRQHQSVEAGRIFEELQDAGMKVARLEPDRAAEGRGSPAGSRGHGKRRNAEGVELLREQNRVHEVGHRGERFAAIARAYRGSRKARSSSRRTTNHGSELNAAIRGQLREAGAAESRCFKVRVLLNRQEITGEDRGVASSYRVGDAVRYLRGSEPLGLEAKSYATVIGVDGETNQITVQKADGKAVTYDPVRLKGVTIYAAGDAVVCGGRPRPVHRALERERRSARAIWEP